MKPGDHLQATVADASGAIVLKAGSHSWRGVLLEPIADLKPDARIRIRMLGSGAELAVWALLLVHSSSLENDASIRLNLEVLQLHRQDVDAPRVSPAGVRGGVEIMIVAANGRLEVRSGGLRYTAWVMRRPPRLHVGLEMHLRVVLPGSTEDSGITESVDVLGQILQVDGSGRMPFTKGGRFEFGIVRHLGGEKLPLPVLGPERIQRLLDAWAEENGSPRIAARPIATPPPLPRHRPEAGSRPPAPEGPDMPSGIIGNLQVMSFIELLQSLSMNRKTVKVEIQDRGRVGTAFLRQGELSSVFDADLSGEEAFYALARMQCGSFRVHFDPTMPPDNVHHTLTFLALEHLRRLDEESFGHKVAPLPDSVAGVFRFGDEDAPAAEGRIDPADLAPDESLIIDVVEPEAAPDATQVSGDRDEETPVEPIRPRRSRPEVTLRTPVPSQVVASNGGVSHPSPFASFFSETADQGSTQVHVAATGETAEPVSLRPELESVASPRADASGPFASSSDSGSVPPQS